jgi:hypothetical protein
VTNGLPFTAWRFEPTPAAAAAAAARLAPVSGEFLAHD